MRSKRAITDLYTADEYARHHLDWHREHSRWKVDQVLRMLRRHARVPGSVVEVGCGSGGVLAALQRELTPSTGFMGYDIVAAAIELARPLANDRLHFILGDFLARSALLRETGYNVVDWFFTAVELDLPPPETQQQRLRAVRRAGRRFCPALTARVLGGFSMLMLCEPQCR